MARIPIKRVTPDNGIPSKRELYATICYFYPQYKLKEAAKLPYRDIVLLIKQAQRQKSIEYLNFTQIIAAPHTKKGEGVKSLIEQYKKASE